MTITLRKILRPAGIAAAALVLLVLVFSLYAYFHKPFLKNTIEKRLAKTPGLSLEIGKLDYKIFPLRFEADAVRLEMTGAMGTLRARADNARGRGSLARIVRGRKPFLDSLEISGLRVEFDQPADLPPSEELSFKDLAATASGYLAYFGGLSIRGSDVHLDFKAMGLAASVEGFDFAASMGSEGSYQLGARRLAVRKSVPESEFAAAVASTGTWPPQSLDWFRGDIAVRNAEVSLPGKSWKWDETESSLDAAFVLDEEGVSLSRLTFGVPGLVAVSGSGRTGWGADSAFDVSCGIGLDDVAKARNILEPFLALGVPGLSVEGGVSFEGELRRDTGSGKAEEVLTGTFRIPSLQVGYLADGLDLRQTLRGEFRLEGPLAGPNAEGRLEGSGGHVRTDTVRVEGLSCTFPVDYGPGGVTSSGFNAKAGRAALSAGSGGWDIEGPALRGKATFDPGSKKAVLRAFELDIPGFGTIGLEGEGRFRAAPEFSARLEASEVGIADALRFFAPLIPDSAGDWGASGKINLALDVRKGAENPKAMDIGGILRFSSTSFQNPSGTIISEGVEPRLEFSARLAPAGSRIPFALLLDLAKGESLWNEAYVNWATLPLRLEAKGEFDPAGGGLDPVEATLTFPPFGEIAVEGSSSFGSTASTDIRVSAPALDLASFYSFWSTMHPTQPASWDLAGKAVLDMRLRLDRSFSAQGLLRISETTAAEKGGSVEISGLAADVPFSISNRLVPEAAGGDFFIAPGRVRIEKFRAGSVLIEPLEVAFFSARNLFLLFPLELDLWDARVRLGKSVVSLSPVTLAARAASTLSLGELDLARLTEAAESFKLVGKVAIPESRIVVRQGELSLDGTLFAEVYGGKANVRNIGALDPFSDSRTIFLDAEIEGLDLEKLTDSVPFGKVTGIVDITLGNLALSYGQPESFDLKIESVPTKGVSRKFSLKAVDDLSVISSGGGAAMPSSSFFTRLISSFGYERIGISCSLENDVFTLRSTIVEGGVHYLVRRSPLFGIDVVNRRPVNRISFKDMIGRLQRVGQSQEKK